MKLLDLFQSKAQVRLVEHLLQNRDKVFNQAGLARVLDVSPSTVARIVEPLVKCRVLMFEHVLIATGFKRVFLFPICLSAQFTAFLTKLRSSDASLIIKGRKSRNVLSEASLLCTASSAIR